MRRPLALGLFLLLALFACVLSPPAAAQQTPADSGRRLALVGAKIYPSPKARPILDGVVLIENGRIVAVGAGGRTRVPPGTTTIDCKGLTLIAGFWNSHVHFTEPQWENAARLPPTQLTRQLQEMLTRYGFTTVFDTGSLLENTKALRRRVEAGEAKGPRILTAGEPIYPRDGIPFYLRDLKIKLPEAATPEQALALVREKVDGGADAVKIFAGSWVGGDRVVEMPPELVKAITAEAHRRGRPVLAHPQSAAGLRSAVGGGVDVLVHTAPDAGAWDASLLSEMKRSRVALIPTLKLWRAEAEKAGRSAEVVREFQNAGVRQLRAYAKAGGQILFGTDVGYMTDYDTAEEYVLMAQAGMTFRQILASLTTAPAARFGASRRTGRITPGMDADVVLLAGDPAADIKALANVRYTIRRGEIIYQSK